MQILLEFDYPLSELIQTLFKHFCIQSYHYRWREWSSLPPFSSACPCILHLEDSNFLRIFLYSSPTNLFRRGGGWMRRCVVYYFQFTLSLISVFMNSWKSLLKVCASLHPVSSSQSNLRKTPLLIHVPVHIFNGLSFSHSFCFSLLIGPMPTTWEVVHLRLRKPDFVRHYYTLVALYKFIRFIH